MDTVKVLCGSCKGITNHQVLAEKDAEGEDEEISVQWWASYQIIQCLGCENISFRVCSSNTDEYDPQTGRLVESVKLFPDRCEHRLPVDGWWRFPPRTKSIYQETLSALNNQSPILAAIGLRAVIESICLEKGTRSRNLEGGIDELAEMGLLSIKQVEFLHNHRFMGNVAAHEMQAPKPEHLVAALDIAETLLKTIYVLPAMAEEIERTRASTPSVAKG